MFDHISGTIGKQTKQGIILCAGSFGFEINVAQPTLFQIGDSVKIYVYLHWNQEQGPSLYGFHSELDKTVFMLAISCSGIGPKVGLAILSDIGAQTFVQAIQTSNLQTLSAVGGIGMKKAEHILVQLKHKVAQLVMHADFSVDENQQTLQTVAQALEALHYSRAEIAQALMQARTNTNHTSFDQLLRSALLFLSKQP